MLIRLLLIFTVCVWGWSFVATKIALEYLAPLQVIGLRYVLGLPIMLAVIAGKRRVMTIEGRDWRLLAPAAAVITGHFLIQVVGMQYTTATNTGWLISVTPLVMALLSVIFLGERLTGRAVGGIVVATLGVLVLVSRGNILSLEWLQSMGDWLVLGSAHTWAVFTILTRNLSRKYNPLVVTFRVLSLSALVILPTAILTTDVTIVADLPGRAVAAVLYLGIAVQGLAFWFWQEGIARLGAARAGIFLYLEPLATTAVAVPLLDEPFGAFIAVGGLAVLGGVYLAERRIRRAAPQASSRQ